jgi:hypothetical protein
MERLARRQDRVLGKSRGSDVGLLCGWLETELLTARRFAY